MKTTKTIKRLLGVKSKSANRIIRKRWETTYLEMSEWHSSLDQLFHRWLDWNGIAPPVGYLSSGKVKSGKVNPEWQSLMDRYIEEEGQYTSEQEAFILGFWSREVGLETKWRGDEESMLKWMLSIH